MALIDITFILDFPFTRTDQLLGPLPRPGMQDSDLHGFCSVS